MSVPLVKVRNHRQQTSMPGQLRTKQALAVAGVVLLILLNMQYQWLAAAEENISAAQAVSGTVTQTITEQKTIEAGIAHKISAFQAQLKLAEQQYQQQQVRLLAELRALQSRRVGKPLTPLLQKLEALHCAQTDDQARELLNSLINAWRAGQGWPDEMLGQQQDDISLYAGTLDIALSTLYRTLQRFPQLTELSERVVLQWNYCPLLDESGGFFNLYQRGGQLYKKKANPPFSRGWEGFQHWGFSVTGEGDPRYVPELLKINTPFYAYEDFLHRVYRQQCFPHPDTGDLYPVNTEIKVLTRTFHPPIASPEAEDYPFLWYPVCEIPQVTKGGSVWPEQFLPLLQRASYRNGSLEQQLNTLALSARKIRQQRQEQQQDYLAKREQITQQLADAQQDAAMEEERRVAEEQQRLKDEQIAEEQQRLKDVQAAEAEKQEHEKALAAQQHEAEEQARREKEAEAAKKQEREKALAARKQREAEEQARREKEAEAAKKQEREKALAARKQREAEEQARREKAAEATKRQEREKALAARKQREAEEQSRREKVAETEKQQRLAAIGHQKRAEAEQRHRAALERQKRIEAEQQQRLAAIKRQQWVKAEQQRRATLERQKRARAEQQRLASLSWQRSGKFTSDPALPAEGFVPIPEAEGEAEATPLVNTANTAQGRKEKPKKLGVTATLLYTAPLNGTKPSGKANISWSPAENWFVRGSMKYVDNEELTYTWGVGYSNWRPGTTSIQLNNWGPLKRGDGLDIENAVLSVSHKVDSELLSDHDLSATVGLSSPLTGDPAANLTFQWSPFNNIYFRTTASQGLEGGPAKWSYGFGYYDWRPGTWRLEYSNYGDNRYPFDNFSEGVVTLNRAWEF